MAINLIDSDDITVSQSGENIELNTTVDMQTIETNVLTNTTNIANITGTILWTNPNPSSSFIGQTITITGEDYDVYEIYYKMTASSDYLESIRFIKGHGSFVEIADIVNRVGACSRIITSSSDTEIIFEDCKKTTGTNDNAALIPLYIVGYNTGLFS